MIPLLTTVDPSKPHGLPDVPHVNDVGVPTVGLIMNSLSSPPAALLVTPLSDRRPTAPIVSAPVLETRMLPLVLFVAASVVTTTLRSSALRMGKSEGLRLMRRSLSE